VDAAFGPGEGLDPKHTYKDYGNPLTKVAVIITLEMAWSCPKPRGEL